MNQFARGHTAEKKLELCAQMGYPQAFYRPEQALKPVV
jgi:hypothetical protein